MSDLDRTVALIFPLKAQLTILLTTLRHGTSTNAGSIGAIFRALGGSLKVAHIRSTSCHPGRNAQSIHRAVPAYGVARRVLMTGTIVIVGQVGRTRLCVDRGE